MKANIIVREVNSEKIVNLREVTSFDAFTVSEAIRKLREYFPAPAYMIDTSQVFLAREALRAA